MRDSVLVTTVPFGEADARPRDLLTSAGVDWCVQGLGRRLKEQELAQLAHGHTVLVAGTEPITASVFDANPQLRLVSRVGVGLDGVDLIAARERGISVSYTPEAPAPAVAELAVGLMLALLRHITVTDRGMRSGTWERRMGRRLAMQTVGVIGVGRIGRRVIQILRGGFPTARILANDLVEDDAFADEFGVTYVDRETLLRESDVLTLHVPLTPGTRGMIGERELGEMKSDAVVVNTARGGIIDEAALASVLRRGHLLAAAVDVFENEPYSGDLASIQNCILTCHMASMTSDCRVRMELEATEEAIRFLRGDSLQQEVPQSEYAMRAVIA